MSEKYYCVLLHKKHDLEKYILPKSTRDVIFIHAYDELKICTTTDIVSTLLHYNCNIYLLYIHLQALDVTDAQLDKVTPNNYYLWKIPKYSYRTINCEKLLNYTKNGGNKFWRLLYKHKIVYLTNLPYDYLYRINHAKRLL